MLKLTPWWFTPKAENPDNATFRLRPLTTPQKMDLLDTYRDDGNGILLPTHRSYMTAVRFGVIETRDWTDPRTTKPARVPSCFDSMPPSWVIECATELMIAAMPDEAAPSDQPEIEGLEKN
jgi:hypothetical protein